jgi:serine/threonine protein phosphatase PrpC
VTRAFGDAAFKLQPSPHVLASPEVTRTQLTPDLRFLILATDGLWDVLTDQAAVDVAQGAREGLPGDEVKMAEALVQAALLRGSMDNVTAAVMLLDW